jgi:hypothetical protein
MKALSSTSRYTSDRNGKRGINYKRDELNAEKKLAIPEATSSVPLDIGLDTLFVKKPQSPPPPKKRQKKADRNCV